jgi:hypothetical protein
MHSVMNKIRTLTKVVYDSNSGLAFKIIRDFVEIYVVHFSSKINYSQAKYLPTAPSYDR